MGLSKKLARKRAVEKTKIVEKAVEKTLRAEHKGRMIARSNLSRMDAYIKTYWGSCFAYVMRTVFKMTHKQILHMFNELDRHEEFLTTREKWKCKVSWFKAGLYIECKGFRIDPCNEWKMPKGADFQSWCEYYVDATFKAMTRKMHIIFYWIMHDSYGFNKVRLERAKVALRGMRALSYTQFKAMWEVLAAVKPSKGCADRYLNPENSYKIMKDLTSNALKRPDEAMEYRVVNIAVRR